MPPPPFVTCRRTAAVDGWSWSRSGPTVPLDFAALSVWQPSQPAVANTCAPDLARSGSGVLEPPPPPPPPPQAASDAARAASAADRSLGGRALTPSPPTDGARSARRG